MGMFTPALWWHIGDCTLDNLQQSLLSPLARDITGNRRVIRLARFFVDLVDVYDAPLGTCNIKVRRLYQSQEDFFDILTDIPRLCQRGRISNAERHIQYLCKRLGQ